MRIIKSFFKSRIFKNSLVLILFLSTHYSAIAQMSKEKAEELWILRQDQINTLYQEGELDSALTVAQENVDISENAFGSSSWQYVSSLMNLAQIQSELELLENANQTFELALGKSVSVFGENAEKEFVAEDS